MAWTSMTGRRGRSGIAATELAVLAPVLTLLTFGASDVAQVMQSSLRLERAARTGAQYAIANPSDLSAVRSAVLSALPGVTTVSVPMPVQSCECGSIVVSCTAICAGGLTRVITISATQSLSPLLLTDRRQGVGSAVVRVR